MTGVLIWFGLAFVAGFLGGGLAALLVLADATT